jgi:hypothetical protein
VLALLALAGLAPAQQPALGPPQNNQPDVIAKPATWSVPRAPTLRVPSPVVPVRYQQPAGRGRPYTSSSGDDEGLDYQIQLEPPGLERLTAGLSSDPDLQERIRQETLGRQPRERVTFPEEPILSRDRYYGRGGIWPQRAMIVEPDYTCYRKLLFEDKNTERYGWELGMLQPLVSLGIFWYDFAALPLHCFADPCGKTDCSVGYCLPGDPVPYRLYPPEITATGTLAEVAVILALVAIFP